MSTIRNEYAGTACGVEGRFFNVITWPDSATPERCRGRIANQQFKATRTASYGGRITVTVRFDDQCKNGHETLSITGDWRHKDGGESFGCLHEEIAATFPEFEHLIPFHLCSTDGPMHYIANTTFLAGDRDCHGKRAGEPTRVEHRVLFGDSPVSHPIERKFAAFIKERMGSGDFQVVGFIHPRDPDTYGEHFTFAGFGEAWHHCPFRTREEAAEMAAAFNTCEVRWIEHVIERSKGKDRELDAARRAAIWPNATDDQLCSDKIVLEGLLRDRLPRLLEQFQRIVEDFGFLYGVPVSA